MSTATYPKICSDIKCLSFHLTNKLRLNSWKNAVFLFTAENMNEILIPLARWQQNKHNLIPNHTKSTRSFFIHVYHDYSIHFIANSSEMLLDVDAILWTDTIEICNNFQNTVMYELVLLCFGWAVCVYAADIVRRVHNTKLTFACVVLLCQVC